MSGPYKQLNIEVRRKIERWVNAKVPVREMARVLKRSKATLYRELKRNYIVDESLPKYAGYYGAAAQLKADGRRAPQRKLIKHPDLAKRIIERLKNGWTPEQIGYRMIHERAKLRVCQETIYRYIYSKEGMAQELWWYLPEHRKFRRSRRARKRLPPKFDRDVSILFRPDDVGHRRQFGHWEGDLILFRQSFGQTNITSMVERVSRFAVLLKNPNKRTKPVMGKIMKAILDLPYAARGGLPRKDAGGDGTDPLPLKPIGVAVHVALTPVVSAIPTTVLGEWIKCQDLSSRDGTPGTLAGISEIPALTKSRRA